MRKAIREHWGIAVILLLTPLLLFAVSSIWPTHDDWTGATTPDFTPFLTKEHFLFYGYHWRPFDTWIGYVVGRNPQMLYPGLNHLLVVTGHLACTLGVYRLITFLRLNATARNIATLGFFVAPAAMPTVMAVDSQNQVMALAVDLMAFLVYTGQNKYKGFLWPALVFAATLCKENGLMWALICPVLAFGFGLTDRKALRRDLLTGLSVMLLYTLCIFLLPKDIIIHPEYVPDARKMTHNCVKFLFSSLITVDYVYLLHPPKRNLLMAAVSFVPTLPLLYYVFFKPRRLLVSKKAVCIMLCLLTAVMPHIGTVYSMMHTYAGLPLITLLAAFLIDSYGLRVRPVLRAFALFTVTAVAIDTHLWIESAASGLIGKSMAIEAIRKTGSPVKKVYVIMIEEDFEKLSSFCCVPYEAFGWGIASKYETGYKWPEIITDTVIARTADYPQRALAIGKDRLSKGLFDCVWIADHEDVHVIKK